MLEIAARLPPGALIAFWFRSFRATCSSLLIAIATNGTRSMALMASNGW